MSPKDLSVSFVSLPCNHISQAIVNIVSMITESEREVLKHWAEKVLGVDANYLLGIDETEKTAALVSLASLQAGRQMPQSA